MVGMLSSGWHGPRRAWWRPALAATLAAVLAAPAVAESAADPAPANKTAAASTPTPNTPTPTQGDGLLQTGGGGILPGFLPPGDSDCGPGGCGGPGGCDGCCYAGHKPCDCCVNSDSCCGRFFGGLYECICCPDPCYEPHWVPLANAAFFVDGARPVTQMRFRGDFGWDLQFPDRSEFFWARSDGKGKGLGPVALIANQKIANERLDYQEGTLYTEAAIERLGVFVEVPYLHVSPDEFGTASGLGDINVGTKTLLLDCDLIQFTFQFRAFVPSGNFTRGLGTGHASLEPSFLMAIKLSPTTYFQAQTSYWFPIGGDSEFQGNVFHYHLSVNHLIWNCGHDIQLIATFEASGYEFTSGEFTDPLTLVPLHSTSVGSIFNIGPGIRLDVCDKIDFGVGTSFAITNDHLAEDLVRAEFRVRF
jgi:hypothetical protein